MSGFVESQMDDADRAGLDYSLDATCPGCPHGTHPGPCRYFAAPRSGVLIPCPCKERGEITDDTDRRNRDDDPSVDTPTAGPAVGPGPVLGPVGDAQGRAPVTTIHAALADLTAALDEPLVIFGGKSAREMLGGRGARA